MPRFLHRCASLSWKDLARTVSDEAGLRTRSGGRAFVSADDVARRAGVSRSAVSRTFTPGASVSDETRRRVISAAEALGYHVNHLARGLIRQRSGIVCLIASDVETPQIARLVRTLTQRLQDNGRVAMLLSLKGADVTSSVLQQALNYRAEATVVMSGTPSESIVRSALASGQRLVLINRSETVTGPDHVRVVNETAGEAALRAFVRAGCRNLAVVGSARRTPSLTAREDSFIGAARVLGIEPQMVREGEGPSYDNGRAAARVLFTGPVRPDAIFCINDLMALGTMDSARLEFGLAIPDDVSVIGFDNIPQAEWLSYRLTTFDQPFDAMADAAVDLIIRERADGAEPVSLAFPPQLVWRDTVRR
jgi:DNA-binding LacI/PurR family transcriptional regulator